MKYKTYFIILFVFILSSALSSCCTLENINCDYDGDGIINGNDKCPESKGVAANQGCPVDKTVSSEPSTTLATSTTSSPPSIDTPYWTFLMYMNADNNLEEHAMKDFREMAKIGSTDAVTILAQIDRADGYYHGDGNWTQALRFKIKKNDLPTVASAIEDLGEVDMNSDATLFNFIKWGMDNYPSKKYVLVIWSHGSGWRTDIISQSLDEFMEVNQAEIDSIRNDTNFVKPIFTIKAPTSNLIGNRMIARRFSTTSSRLTSTTNNLRSTTSKKKYSKKEIQTLKKKPVDSIDPNRVSYKDLQATIFTKKYAFRPLVRKDLLVKKINIAPKSKVDYLRTKLYKKGIKRAKDMTDIDVLEKAIKLENNSNTGFTNYTNTFKAITGDQNGSEMLFNSEIKSVLKRLDSEENKKLSMICFDACLMGMIETAYALKENTDYMVASEEVVQHDGWDYSKLFNDLYSEYDISTEALGIKIIDNYVSSYKNTYSVTKSMIDLRQIDTVAILFDSLLAEMESKLDDELYNIEESRNQCKSYIPGDNESNSISFLHFLNIYKTTTTDTDIQSKIDILTTHINNAIVKSSCLRYYCKTDGISYGSKGLAIYFPNDITQYLKSYSDSNEFYPIDFVVDHHWDNFLFNYLTKLASPNNQNN